MTNEKSTLPGRPDRHRPHHTNDCDDGGAGQTGDAPMKKCAITLTGEVDCCECPEPLVYTHGTHMLDCGEEALSVEILGFFGLLINKYCELVSVVDMGHSGWLLIYRKATIWP